MPYQVVVIFKENDDFNVSLMLLEDYPYLRVPQEGDIVPIVSTATIQSKTRHGPVTAKTIRYLDGIYEVMEVWAGSGQLLHPTQDFNVYRLDANLTGYGIRVRKCDLPGYEDIAKCQASLVDGTWPPHRP